MTEQEVMTGPVVLVGILRLVLEGSSEVEFMQIMQEIDNCMSEEGAELMRITNERMAGEVHGR